MTRMRHTPQRDAIDAAFTKAQRPLSIDEVLELAREQVGSMDPATVYRNLGRMVEEGRLARVSLPTKGVVYELTHRKHHHHFYCRKCDRAFELPGCGLTPENQVPADFQVEDHDVFLYGKCPECVARP
jgi:Fur family ferric uptake transcriptional regulator